MKETFVNQLTEELELLELLLEESTDKQQEQSIIRMMVDLSRYINKLVH